MFSKYLKNGIETYYSKSYRQTICHISVYSPKKAEVYVLIYCIYFPT